MATGNRTLGGAASCRSFDRRSFLHRRGRAVDLSGGRGTDFLCRIPAGRLCPDFVDRGDGMRWHNCLAAASRLSHQRRYRHPGSAGHCLSHRAACRHVHRCAVRGVSVSAVGELSNWTRAAMAAAAADGGLGEFASRLRGGTGADRRLCCHRIVGDDILRTDSPASSRSAAASGSVIS